MWLGGYAFARFEAGDASALAAAHDAYGKGCDLGVAYGCAMKRYMPAVP